MQVSVDTVEIERLDGTKSGALLAYLALERHQAIRRTQLAAAFWPELDEKAARNNLRQTLHNLRQRLEGSGMEAGHALELQRETARLNPEAPHWMDTMALEPSGALDSRPDSRPGREAIDALRSAMESYRGPFLQTFTALELPDTVMDWVWARRATFQQMAREKLAQLTDALALAGALDQAILHAQQYLRAEPLDESAHRLLMRLRHSGEWYEQALEQYDAFAQLLARELDVDPAPETTALQGRIQTLHDRARQQRLATAACSLERLAVTVVAVVVDRPEGAGAEHIANLRNEIARRIGRIVEDFGATPGRSHGGQFLLYFGFPGSAEAATHQALKAAYRIAATDFDGSQARVAVHSGVMLTSRDPGLPDPSGELSEMALVVAGHASPAQCLVTDEMDPDFWTGR